MLDPSAARDKVGVGVAGADAVQRFLWRHVHAAVDSAVVAGLRRELGKCESEAIALALEVLDFSAVIVVNGRARRRSAASGMAVTGTAGVLTAARARGLITSARRALDDARAVGLYSSDGIYVHPVPQSGQ